MDNVKEPLTDAQKLELAKVMALQEAMEEILREQQPEIIRRTAEKLARIGVQVEP